MGLLNLFSKRQRRQRGEFPDVYQYSEIPDALRVQIVHIWRSAFGPISGGYGELKAGEVFRMLNEQLCREYGKFKLTDDDTFFGAVANFMLTERDPERVLDVIEISFHAIDSIVRQNPHEFFGEQSPEDAIHELNQRFKEHGVGFQFESGEIIKVNSQFVHAEVVQPALAILRKARYKGANDEFLSAHKHYREGKYKECLNDCLKSFESTMKAICKAKGWQYQQGDTAKALLALLFEKQLVPEFLQSHFGGLRSTLEAGVPTVRNKLGGHGQGPDKVDVPDEMAAYALHLTATNIVFLVGLADK